MARRPLVWMLLFHIVGSLFVYFLNLFGHKDTATVYLWVFSGLILFLFLWFLLERFTYRSLVQKVKRFDKIPEMRKEKRYVIVFPVVFLIGALSMGRALSLESVWAEENQTVTILGTVEKREKKTNSDALIIQEGWKYCQGELLDVSGQQTMQIQDWTGTTSQAGAVESVSGKDSGTLSEGFIFQNTKGRLLVYIEKEQEIVPGDTVYIQGTTAFFEPATNPGQFDQKNYQRNKGIVTLLFGKKWYIKEKGSFFASMIWHFRESLSEFYSEALPGKEAGIVISMSLGDRSLMDSEIKELFSQVGIAHILAISGLHISLLGMALYRILMVLGCFRQTSCSVTITFLFLYGMLTGFSVSATRAILMTSLCLIGEIIGEAYDLLSGLSFAALCCLIPNPMQLFDMGFQLSYCAIINICVFVPKVEALVFHTKQEKEQIAKEKGAVNHLQRKLVLVKTAGTFRKKINQLFRWITKTCFTGFLLNLFMAPILLWHLYEIPIYSIIINLFVLPFTSILLVLIVIGGLIGLCVPPAGYFLMGGVHFILSYYLKSSELVSTFPYAQYIGGRPSVWKMFIVYSLFLVLFGFGKLRTILIERENQNNGALDSATQRDNRKKALYFQIGSRIDREYSLQICGREKKENFLQTSDERKRESILQGYLSKNRRKIPIRSFLARKWKCIRPYLTVAYLFLLAGVILWPNKREELMITMLDVGQGDGLCIQTAQHCLMVDGGSSDEKQIGTYRLEPFLNYYGIQKVDYWFVSHVDKDHISGLSELLEKKSFRGRIGTVVLPGIKNVDEDWSELAQKALEAGCRVITFSRDDRLQLGDTVSFQCLYPEKERIYEDRNDGSMVLSFSYGTFSMLFMGDLARSGEQRLMELGDLPENISVLKVGHHGSKTACAPEFLSWAKPWVSLISCGQGNRYGHPHEQTIQELENIGTDIRCTMSYGAITLRIKETESVTR